MYRHIRFDQILVEVVRKTRWYVTYRVPGKGDPIIQRVPRGWFERQFVEVQ